MRTNSLVIALALVGMTMVGCKKAAAPEASTAPAATAAAAPAIQPPDMSGVDAGIPLTGRTKQPPAAWRNRVAEKEFVPRPDPYALMPVEASFEAKQEAERLVVSMGGWHDEFTPVRETIEEAKPIQTQPYRRLAGVIVADSVMAIIEMGNGRPPELVRPGQKVPNTEWTVVSINQDQAVLRRGGSVRPHEVVVRLESRPLGN